MDRRTATARLLTGAFATSISSVLAQDGKPYPSRTIRLIVGYSAGGTTDALGRLLARRLQDALGQPVVVENRPGTNGIVAATMVAKASQDGYTLLVGASGQLVFNAAVNPSLPFSSERDFTPISTLASFPLVLSVNAASKINTLSDLVRVSKEDPKKSNYSASASNFRLASELLKQKTGISAEHVPYKGSTDSMSAVASGEVLFTMLDTGTAAGALRGKMLRGLAVTSDQRLEAFPDIPTFKELGIDLSVQLWTGLLAPAGTPQSIINLLERETSKAMAHADSLKQMSQLNVQPRTMSSSDFRRAISSEIRGWAAVAKENNISFQ